MYDVNQTLRCRCSHLTYDICLPKLKLRHYILVFLICCYDSYNIDFSQAWFFGAQWMDLLTMFYRFHCTSATLTTCTLGGAVILLKSETHPLTVRCFPLPSKTLTLLYWNQPDHASPPHKLSWNKISNQSSINFAATAKFDPNTTTCTCDTIWRNGTEKVLLTPIRWNTFKKLK